MLQRIPKYVNPIKLSRFNTISCCNNTMERGVTLRSIVRTYIVRTRINKAGEELLLTYVIKHKKEHGLPHVDDENPGPGLKHAQKCGGIKLDNEPSKEDTVIKKKQSFTWTVQLAITGAR